MRVRKCCVECSKRRKKLSECRPRGAGNKCWTCNKWNRECSFVHEYPASLEGMVFEPSREEKRIARDAEAREAAARDAAAGVSAAPAASGRGRGRGRGRAATGGRGDFEESRKRPRPEGGGGGGAPPAARPREGGRMFELAFAAAQAASATLRQSSPGPGADGGDSAAAARSLALSVSPGEAAQVALMAWAAASDARPPAPAPAPPAPAAPSISPAPAPGERSLVVSVPDMMCLGSCARTIGGALERVPGTALAGVNVPRRLAHVRTTAAPGTVLRALEDVGFESEVVTDVALGVPHAGGAWADEEDVEWDLADTLGLVSAGCSRRQGGRCACGPSCMCHFCPVHHPERADALERAGRRGSPPAKEPAHAAPPF